MPADGDARTRVGSPAYRLYVLAQVASLLGTTMGLAAMFWWVLDLPRDIQAAVLMTMLIGGFAYQFAVTNPLMATDAFHLSSVGYGLLGTFMAVGGIAANYWSSRRGDPGLAEVLAWAALFGLVEVTASVLPAAWAYDLAMVAIGGLLALFTTTCMVYIQQNAPAAQRGHAVSAYNAAFIGFVPAGAFCVAGLAAAAGVRWSLVGPGLAVLACAGGVGVSRRWPLRRTSPA